MRRRIHACPMMRRIHACDMRRWIHASSVTLCRSAAKLTHVKGTDEGSA
jgi:hypothetical protein